MGAGRRYPSSIAFMTCGITVRDGKMSGQKVEIQKDKVEFAKNKPVIFRIRTAVCKSGTRF